jgi:hypothetical protein
MDQVTNPVTLSKAVDGTALMRPNTSEPEIVSQSLVREDKV